MTSATPRQPGGQQWEQARRQIIRRGGTLCLPDLPPRLCRQSIPPLYSPPCKWWITRRQPGSVVFHLLGSPKDLAYSWPVGCMVFISTKANSGQRYRLRHAFSPASSHPATFFLLKAVSTEDKGGDWEKTSTWSSVIFRRHRNCSGTCRSALGTDFSQSRGHDRLDQYFDFFKD